MARGLLLIPVLVALSPAPALSWGAAGHMTTAAVAYDLLDDDVRKQVDRWIAAFSKAYRGSGYDFVTVATWPDDVKRNGVKAFSHWHFYNRPIPDDSTWTATEPNVLWAVDQCLRVLKSDTANDFEKGMFAAFLIHFVGDVHQPLHCADRFTPEHPCGDGGGNQFKIADHAHYDELHSLWDDGCGIFPALEHGKRPGRRQLGAIRRLAGELERANPPGTQGRAELWASESWELAHRAYEGIEEGAAPGEAYLERSREILRKRVAAGGQRLAALLNEVVGAPAER